MSLGFMKTRHSQVWKVNEMLFSWGISHLLSWKGLKEKACNGQTFKTPVLVPPGPTAPPCKTSTNMEKVQILLILFQWSKRRSKALSNIKINFLYSSLNWVQDGNNIKAMLLSINFSFKWLWELLWTELWAYCKEKIEPSSQTLAKKLHTYRKEFL